MITDPAQVVARLRYPMGLTGIDGVMKGLSSVYRDDDLVVITDGPLFEVGWMVVAHPTPEPEDAA